MAAAHRQWWPEVVSKRGYHCFRDIAHHDIECAGLEQRDRLGGISGKRHLVTFVNKRIANQIPDIELIVHQQYTRHT